MVRHNVYSSYEEKYVKFVVLYAEKNNGGLFYDVDYKEEVNSEELRNIFGKGLVVDYDDGLYSPISMVFDDDTEKTELKIHTGTTAYTFKTDEPEEEVEIIKLIEVTPATPTFDDETGIITIVAKEGVVYKIGEDVLESGEQEPITPDTDVKVVASAADGYVLADGATFEWTFSWTGHEQA